MDNLKEKTAKGLLWGALNSSTMQVLNLVFGIFLARMLSPHDYGIVGVLAIFSLIAGNLQSRVLPKDSPISSIPQQMTTTPSFGLIYPWASSVMSYCFFLLH